MQSTRFIPLAVLALAVACTENAPNPVESTPHGASLSSVHLKGGAHAEPSFTDNGLSLTASGELSGLGNGDITVRLVATANATATCTNPGTGVHQPAGQNPAPVTVSGGQSIPAGSIINGNVPFSVTTAGPQTPIAGAPGCPNANWTEDITDLAFTSATITVRQPDTDGTGPIVFTVTCTFSPATSNGPVPGNRVTCT